MNTFSSASRHPPPATSQPYSYDSIPPDEPPPSYDDATQSSTAPLLVGPPPDYGTYRAYSDPDPDLEESSVASSDTGRNDGSLPVWVGQALVVLVFVSIMYGFWRFITAPDDLHNGWPG
ncbi:hypothetical protein P153DRAFT_356554 [Dothidotthia symphoricarpi CBS 119687]|uniref:Uncharacterized protein n=1 Tax=Dothidotthia symphoricarpi CBS 119687 TaxID=1392245 RepID=A0A6A6AG39_9PLEO|nr:uncharacterized protein P153DRAFT_356554 [Dothidotthia symphoricarpi CBS 119687]KAF2129877.1 hypothetical protein P153DRAFT_356554 [Dothidotthia symphoricarpi CBS 119687]